MREIFIDTTEELEQLVRDLENSQWLALDTEFMRERTYYPIVCLIQISNGKISACIDPLSIKDLSPLRDLLFNENTTKVFHAGSQDLEIFLMLWGKIPTPVFDTQLAATLLGLGEQIGYGNLVQNYLGVHLSKAHSRADWSVRPLDQDQLRYAHDDVIYLGKVYEKMTRELNKQNRTDWLQDDFAKLENSQTYQPAFDILWSKVKGKQLVKGKQVAVLQALAVWRENYAIKNNRPKRWLLKDEILIDLAKRMPENIDQLHKIRGMEAKVIKSHGETLLNLIAEAKVLPREQWPAQEKIPSKLNPSQEAKVDFLMCGLRVIANEHHLNMSAICSRKDLEKLVRGKRNLSFLSGWKKSVAGEKLLKLLEGKSILTNQSGRISIIDS